MKTTKKNYTDEELERIKNADPFFDRQLARDLNRTIGSIQVTRCRMKSGQHRNTKKKK